MTILLPVIVLYYRRMNDDALVSATGNDLITSASSNETDLERFESSMQELINGIGLPSNGLFVPVTERKKLVNNLRSVIAELPSSARNRSYYISKMVAAATVGLFDAAINYMWDELIGELRTRVANFDLNYFFDIAAGDNSSLRKQLKTEDDLSNIDDARLLRTSRKIGLLTDVGFARLDHIRFMRNHASAAHPNQNSLSGFELIEFLETCIREVINQPIDNVAVDTGKLLANIKINTLDVAYADKEAAFFEQLPPDRAGALGDGLFGLYTAPDRSTLVADNVRLLWPRLWPYIDDSDRFKYGMRHARATANADTETADAARELLDLADGGNAYLTSEVRALDMLDAIENLRTVHHDINNFYNEPVPAKRLLSLVGSDGAVPENVRDSYVRTVLECYIGNGYGVSRAAEPLYREMIQKFSSQDAGIALRTCIDPVFSFPLSKPSGQSQWEEMIKMLEPKVISRPDRELMDAIKKFNGEPEKLRLDSRIIRLAGGNVEN